MKRTMLLVRSNIRKAKGQTVAIIMLVLLSSIMMNLWLMLSTDYKKNFERSHTKVNDGHVTIAAYTNEEAFQEFVTDMLSGLDEVTEFSVRDALCMPGSFSYGGGEIMASLVVLKKDTALCADVGKVELTEESDLSSGIYLPMLYGLGDNYSVGDMIKLALGSETLEYTVCGFFNSPMMGSHNCRMLMMLLTEDKFGALSEGNAAYPSTCISLRLMDRTKSEKMKTLLLDGMMEAFPDVMLVSDSYEEVAASRYISSMICAGILSVMAFLVLLIGVVVITSNVANTIQDQMQNLGALKAVGYRSGQLVSSFVIQFVVISVLAAVIGCALSYCIFPAISGMMVSQTGIPYQIRVLPVPFFATIGFIFSVVALAVLLSAKKIKKIDPITAIRQGVATHHFKKNAVPLDLTRLPLHAALAMKTASSGLKQNITIGITMLVLSLIIVFSGLMFENVIMDMQPFVDMFAGEAADSAIDVNVSRESEFLSAMKTDSRVEKMHLHTNVNVQHVDGSLLNGMIYDDFSKFNNQNIVIEGRFPKYDNEVAIAAKYAGENGLEVGDEIILKAEGNEQTYLITGFTQLTDFLGKDCAMTREGYERIGILSNASYYIDLTEDTDIDDFNSEVSGRFGNDVNTALNIREILEGAGGVYVALATAIVAAILLVSGIVVVFVMYLLVRTVLNGKKRDYGILKALGYTTGQLILQTALSFMPAVILSAAVGIAVCAQIINPLTALFFSGVGIVKCTFTVPHMFNIFAGTGLVLFAFAAACFMSLRIKKIAPRALISGE